MHFQRVSAGGEVQLEKKTRLASSESHYHTVKAKIFPRNGRSRLKSRSAKVGQLLVHKSHRNSLKIAHLPVQICHSRCYIMRKPTVRISKLSGCVCLTKTALGQGGMWWGGMWRGGISSPLAYA